MKTDLKSDVSSIISSMTLEEKTGALFTLGFAGHTIRSYTLEFIEKLHCSGVRVSPLFRTFAGYKDPKTGKHVASTAVDGLDDSLPEGRVHTRPDVPARLVNRPSLYSGLLDEIQTLARKRRSGLPLHFSFDQEGGSSADFNFGGPTVFPKPMGIRATGDVRLAYEAAKATARQCRALGLHWIHSPVLDINTEPMNPEVYIRAYSDHAETVAEYAVAACKGYRDGGLITTGKHFPGRGDSAQDAHFNIPVIDVDEDTLWNRELLPYRALIDEGLLPSIMIAHSIFPAIDPDDIATVSKPVITGLLREKMGFEGVVTTDSISMGGVVNRYGVAEACAMSLAAGADIVLIKFEEPYSSVVECIDRVKEYIQDGRLPESEVDAKIERILKMKMQYGLFDDAPRENPDEVIQEQEIIALGREVAERSVMVLRDEESVLPLPREGGRILVAEQLSGFRPNDWYWHPGMLWEACKSFNPRVDYYECDTMINQADEDALCAVAGEYDVIVMTSHFDRGRNFGDMDRYRRLIEAAGGSVVLVANSPYEWAIPKEARNAVISWDATPASAAAVAKLLFGEMQSKGEWPLKHTPKP
jgi:beta-N-acetylhexosaminidase